MENKNLIERMNKYDILINAITSTRNIKTNFIGDNTNQKFYDRFFKETSNPNRGIIHKPGTYELRKGNSRNAIVNERTNNGLTWDSINELRKLSGQ